MIRALRCAAVLLAALWAFGVEEAAAQSTISTIEVSSSHRPAVGDTYGRGEVIRIEVVWASGAVLPAAGAAVEVRIGSTTRQFDCLCTGSIPLTTWLFTYTVQAGDSDTDGITVQRLTGTFTRQGGGSVSTTLAGNTVDSANYKVDGTLGVQVTGLALNSPAVGDTYGLGEVIEGTVTFSGAVDVGGTPRLRMTIGSTTRDARYATGHGTTSLTFRYTVVAADTDANGISIAADGVRTSNTRTIRVSGGTRNAVVSLAGRTVSNDANRKVDGSSAPSITVSSGATRTGSARRSKPR